ncbi:hypothetical protein GLA29479_1297 [Lysobacter antibioticus]|nr:hypothetical protein GLA29479_1297 [Lysobacter antibioticus]
MRCGRLWRLRDGRTTRARANPPLPPFSKGRGLLLEDVAVMFVRARTVWVTPCLTVHPRRAALDAPTRAVVDESRRSDGLSDPTSSQKQIPPLKGGRGICSLLSPLAPHLSLLASAAPSQPPTHLKPF